MIYEVMLSEIETKLEDFAYYNKSDDQEEIDCRKSVVKLVLDAIKEAGYSIEESEDRMIYENCWYCCHLVILQEGACPCCGTHKDDNPENIAR